MVTLPVPGKLSAIVATLSAAFMLGLLSTPMLQDVPPTKSRFAVAENSTPGPAATGQPILTYAVP